MRLPTHNGDKALPLSVIQGFGIFLIILILVAGFLKIGDRTILLAVLGIAGGFVVLDGFQQKADRTIQHALEETKRDES